MASGDESESTDQPGTAGSFTLSSSAALDMTALQHQLEIDNISQSLMNTSSDSTSQKLVRALCLAQIGLYRSVSGGPSTSTNDLATVVELLASALKDVSATPTATEPVRDLLGLGSLAVPFTPAQFDPFGSDVNDCEIAHAARAAERESAPELPALDSPISFARPAATSADLPESIMSSLRQLVTLLRPSVDIQPRGTPLPPMLFAKDHPIFSLAGIPTTTAEDAPTPSGSNTPMPVDTSTPAINRLHADLLARILVLARTIKDEASCECEQGCTTSRSESQRWALTLSLVCKDWRVPGRRAAYSHVRIRRRTQLSALVKLVIDDAELGESIRTLDVKVPGLTNAQPGANGHPYAGNPRHSNRRAAAFPWLSPPSPKLGASKHKPEEETTVKPEEELAALVRACTTLSKLDLNVSKPMSHYGWQFGAAEFLEPGLEKALCQSSALRQLTLRTCIDFGELEAILMSCSTLESLQLDAGIDNLDGLDEVLPTQHQARLRDFSLNSFEQSDIGERQLDWILRPSIGSLERLEISTSVALGPAGMGGGATFVPWGGQVFADLLVELAPTLVRLGLKDSLGAATGIATMNPSLRNLPHDGSFDYALRNAHKLEQFAAEWAFLGNDILDVLSTKPLTAVAFLGSPSQVTGPQFVAAFEDQTSFTKLQRLSLVHFALNAHNQLGNGGAPVTGWSARDIRALKRAATGRRLQFDFSTL